MNEIEKYIIYREKILREICKKNKMDKSDYIWTCDLIRQTIDLVYEKFQKNKKIFNSPLKDNSDSSNTNYLETRNRTGEEIKLEHMPVSVDNHVDSPLTNPGYDSISRVDGGTSYSTISINKGVGKAK